MFNKLQNTIKSYWNSLYISGKFLIILCFITFFSICGSVFIPTLDATGSFPTLRTAFSSIVGYLLETSSRKVICTDKILLTRNYMVGLIAIFIVITILLAHFFNASDTNPSLLLLKNTLFSCIGFLISCSENCNVT